MPYEVPDGAARPTRVRFIGETYRILFEGEPLPMWVFDRRSLYIRAVSPAARAQHGCSRNEFLRMTIQDIRLPRPVEPG